MIACVSRIVRKSFARFRLELMSFCAFGEICVPGAAPSLTDGFEICGELLGRPLVRVERLFGASSEIREDERLLLLGLHLRLGLGVVQASQRSHVCRGGRPGKLVLLQLGRDGAARPCIARHPTARLG